MSDDPMRGLFGEAPEPFGFDYGLGGVAAYLPGQESAFNRDILTGIIDSTIQQGLQGLPTAADALADQTTEQEYIEGLISNLDPEVQENIRKELGDFLESQEPEDFSTTGLENNLEKVDMLDPSVVPVDEDAAATAKAAMESEWEEVDKDAEFDVILGKALDIFGAYNRDAISNVVDVVNDRGMSVGEVAIATGNTIESINQAAAESGTAIKNQGLVDPEPLTPDPEPPTPEPPADPETPSEPTVVMDRPADPTVVMDTPVTPEPTLTSFMPDLPKQQQTNITLLQNIMNETPITESILFPTKFTKLENVQQGMFEQFLSAAGGNQ